MDGVRYYSNSCEIRLNSDPVNYFPLELILHTFSFLNANELTQCKLVSRQWYQIASHPLAWKKLFFHSWPYNHQKVRSWEAEFKKRALQKIKISKGKWKERYLGRYKNKEIVKYRVDGSDLYILYESCPFIAKWDLKTGKLDSRLRFPTLSQITSFDVDEKSFYIRDARRVIYVLNKQNLRIKDQFCCHSKGAHFDIHRNFLLIYWYFNPLTRSFCVWNIHNKMPVISYQSSFLAFGKKNSIFLADLFDQKVKYYRCSSSKNHHVETSCSVNGIRGIAYDSGKLYALSKKGDLFIWEKSLKYEPLVLSTSEQAYQFCVQGDILVSCHCLPHSESCIKVWFLPTGRLIWERKIPFVIQIHLDRCFLWTSHFDIVNVYQLDTGSFIRSLEGFEPSKTPPLFAENQIFSIKTNKKVIRNILFNN